MSELATSIPALDDPVSRELRQWAVEPFDDAQANCALSVLAYVERSVGMRAEPPAILRSAAARKIVLRHPGLFIRLADWAMHRLGCEPVSFPRRGDVALVRLAASGLTACICLAEGGKRSVRWGARGKDGPVLESGRCVRAWRVSCRKL